MSTKKPQGQNLLQEISLYSVFKDILTRCYLLLIAAAIGFMGAEIGVEQFYVPQYTSSVVLVVSARDSSNTAYANLARNQQIADVFIEVLQSRMLAEKVAENMGVDSMPGMVSAARLENTNLLKVDAISSSPERAFRLIHGVIDSHASVSDYVFANAVIDVMTEPEMPTGPSNPNNLSMYQTRAAIGCSVGMLIIIIALSILRDTVKNSTSLNTRVDAKNISTIRYEHKYRTLKSRMKRLKVAILITNPMVSRGYVEELRKLYMQLEHVSREKGYKVFMITSTCENEGKSTIAANLAISAASAGKKVLLIDGDFRKPSIHKIFNIELEKEKGVEKCLSRERNLDECLEYLDRYGIWTLLPNRSHSNSAELVSTRRMKEIVMECREQFDLILVDTPPSSILTDAEVMTAFSDCSLLVVRHDFAYVCDINDTIDKLKRCPMLGCVLNNYRVLGGGGKQQLHSTHEHLRGEDADGTDRA